MGQVVEGEVRSQGSSVHAIPFAVHTAGCSLIPQQPLNNLVRISYQALAAVLGGVQSLHCCSYDEPMCLPTEKGHLQALRTQQIIAYETGVTNVADPLGGSLFVREPHGSCGGGGPDGS